MLKKHALSACIILALSSGLFAGNRTDGDTLSLVQKIESWYARNMNYASITALMTVESSFIPFPSEIVIPPAAYVASRPDSKITIWGVVISGTIGALLGALINYFLALWLGRPIIYRFAGSRLGKIFSLSTEKVQRAENYFNKRGIVSTLAGRLIPVIRQLISIPAGLAKMNLAAFAFFTFLGAAIWNCILALLGYLAHGQAESIDRYNKEISIAIVVILCLAIAYYVLKYLLKKRKK
jgi:membrane protein DedA with SNARE-associated domain